MQEKEKCNGSFDFIAKAILTTPLANSFPKSAITIKVKGMPMKANKIQNILPPLVDGTTFPYP